MTDRERITAAFTQLRRSGYICRSNFLCCSSCGAAEIAAKFQAKGVPEDQWKAVYWSRQRNESFRWRNGELRPNLNGTLFLNWQGNGKEIVEALIEAGFGAARIVWDGTDEQSIQITGNRRWSGCG